jgi:type IV secretory pathway VirB2 component (pilin)
MLTPLVAQAFRPEADFYVGWLTLALINAGIAQSKNRSGLLWWLLSLLLGPVATFILVAFCDRRPTATK